MGKTIAGLLVVFIAGLIFGAGLTRLHHQHVRNKMFNDKNFPAKMHKRLMTKLSKKLDLNQDQIQKIDVIMTEMHKQIQTFHTEKFPAIKQIFDTNFDKLKKELNPEQVKKFDQIIKQRGRGILAFPPPPPRPPRPSVTIDKKA